MVAVIVVVIAMITMSRTLRIFQTNDTESGCEFPSLISVLWFCMNPWMTAYDFYMFSSRLGMRIEGGVFQSQWISTLYFSFPVKQNRVLLRPYTKALFSLFCCQQVSAKSLQISFYYSIIVSNMSSYFLRGHVFLFVPGFCLEFVSGCPP